MKVSNKPNLAAGIVLLLLAAFFSISLILQPLDFGQFGPGHNNILFRLGAMLTSVYGFTSILIPVFLFIAAISCFASKWTARKSMRLLTAVIPFFTCFGAEKLCYFFAKGSTFTGLKISVTLIVALMLVVIEFLLAGIAADKINGTSPYSQKKAEEDPSEDENQEEDDYYAPASSSYSSEDYDSSNSAFSSDEKSGFDSAKSSSDSEDFEEEEPEPYNMDSDPVEEESDSKKKRPSLFSRLAERRAEKRMEEENLRKENADSSEGEDIYADAVLPSERIATEEVEEEIEKTRGTADDPFRDVFDQPFSTASSASTSIFTSPAESEERSEKDSEEKLEKATAEGGEEKSLDEENATLSAARDEKDDDEENQSAPGSIITQEEYAALTGFDEEEEADDNQLEWPDTNEIQAKAGNKEGDLSDFTDFAEENQEENQEENAPDADNPDSKGQADETLNEGSDNSPDSDSSERFDENTDEDSENVGEKNSNQTVELGSISFQDEDLFEDLDKSIPEGEILDDFDEEDNLDQGVKKCGVQEMSVFGSQQEDRDDSETLENDFENSFSVYENLVDKEDEDSSKIYHSDDSDDNENDQDFDSQDEEEKSHSLKEDKFLNGFMMNEEDLAEVGIDDEDEDVEEEESNEDFSENEDSEEISDQVTEENSSENDAGENDNYDFTEINYTPDSVLRQQRIEEQQKKSSLSSEIFDDMENDIRKEVKKEFLYKKYGSPEDSEQAYEEEITVPVVNQSSYGPDNAESPDRTDGANTNMQNSIGGYTSGNSSDSSQNSSGESESGFSGQKAELNSAKPLSSANSTGLETAAPLASASSRAMPKKPYFVPTELLEQYADDQYWIIDQQTKDDAVKLKETLNEFGISAEIVGIKKGPVVTMFELAPAPGVKLNRIASLQDNIALSLAAKSVRIVAPIPGRAAVGIEVPNRKRSIVSFREMIEQDLPEFKKMAVPVILGKDILGKSQIIDIAKTPHLLIAGATGAGKSVCVNSIILSILYKRSPKQVKMILVDPKVVELKLYNDIPHLLTPVITEPKKALQALQYCLCEMERRYALLDQMGVRDISSYNTRIEERNICTEKLPYIVIIIDEFADLMATSGKELESNVARLAAMSRAVGIHLVLATQRPSVNVITGLIKANIPSRIAFTVATRTDSNIIIDSVGAEKLLGKGDMLYASAVDPYPIRIQGTFESDNDVEKVVEYVKTLGEPEYIDDEIFVDDEEEEDSGVSLFNEGSDPLYEQALDIVIQSGKASASYIQRRLKIGYNRAARLVEEMEERGIVGPANGSKPREIIHIPS